MPPRNTRNRLPTSSFAALLLKTRREWKLTQEEFAELCDLSGTYISAIERGWKTPPAQTEQKIRSIVNKGKEKALAEGPVLSTKKETKYEIAMDPTMDCTHIVRGAAATGEKILLGELLYLLNAQLNLPTPPSPELVKELLANFRCLQEK